MSSVGSILNSINSSLLSEINSYQAGSATSGLAAAPASTASAPDQIDFSQVAKLYQQLQQLQTSNPAELKQVLTGAATKLNAAAGQQTDPGQADFLSNLASRFQKAADTGDLAALQPPSARSGSGVHHGHHHGGHARVDNDGDQATTSTPAQSSGDTQNLIASILSSGQTSQAGSQIQSLLSDLVNTNS